MGDKVSASLRSDVEDRITALRDALAGSDITRIRSAYEDLERNMQRIGQEVYSQAGAATGGGASASAGPSGAPPRYEPGTVEGEYREV